MSSIVTDKQRKRLLERPSDESSEKVMKDRRLNDFYARKALSRWLDSIEDINLILDTLPPEQLDRNEILKADMVLGLFKITEKLVERFNPSPVVAPDEKGIRHVFRHFRVELPNPFPGMQTATAILKITYEPTSEEIVFFDQFVGHIGKLEEIYTDNEQDPHHYTSDEFTKQILQPLQTSKKNVNAETVSIAGFVDKKEEPE